MIVKNKTVLSGQMATDILIKSASRDNKKKSLYIGGIFLIGVVTLVMGLILNQSNIMVMGAVIAAIGVAFFFYTIVDIKKMKKRIVKNNPEVAEKGIIYDFSFKENSVVIAANIGGKNKNAKYSYQYLKAIYEYDNGYEIIFNEADSIFVLKEGFESPKMEEFFRKNITTTKKKIKLVK